MVRARWALTLILLLVAWPAQDIGAAPWRAQAAAPEHGAAQERAPEHGQQAVPVLVRNIRAFHINELSEYEDEKRQTSLETSRLLHEILRQLKMIMGGVNSLSLNSAVRRRSEGADSSAVNDGADPNLTDEAADPNLAAGRSEPNSGSVTADNFQKYCIEGIVAVLGSMLLGMVVCCVIHVWRKRKKRLAASKASSERGDSRAETSRIFAGV